MRYNVSINLTARNICIDDLENQEQSVLEEGCHPADRFVTLFENTYPLDEVVPITVRNSGEYTEFEKDNCKYITFSTDTNPQSIAAMEKFYKKHGYRFDYLNFDCYVKAIKMMYSDGIL